MLERLSKQPAAAIVAVAVTEAMAEVSEPRRRLRKLETEGSSEWFGGMDDFEDASLTTKKRALGNRLADLGTRPI